MKICKMIRTMERSIEFTYRLGNYSTSLKKILKYQLQDDTSLTLVFYCRRVAHRLVTQFASLKQYFILIPNGIGSCQSRVWHG